MKNKYIKYLIISCLVILLIVTGFYIYSNNLNAKLNEQIKVMLSEVGMQNKLIVESEIINQQNLVKQLSKTMSSTDSFDNEVIEVLKKIYNENNYKNIGIVSKEMTIYITENKVEIKKENFYDNLENKNSIIILDDDPINNEISIFIGENIENKDAILFFSYDLSNLVDRLSIPTFNGDGYTYIVASDGKKILASNNKTDFNDFENIFDIMIEVDTYNKNVVENLKTDFQQLKSNGTLFFNRTFKYMYYTPLGINDWYILTIVPTSTTDAIYKDIMSMTLIVSIYVTIIVAIIFIIVSIMIYLKNKRLYNAVYVDKLTGGYSYEKFKIEYKNLNRKKTLIMLDINNFKLLNEIYGHEFSDEVLINVYKILNRLNKDGFNCRKAADHYLICVNHQGQKSIISFVNKLYNSIRRVKIDNSDFVITATFGIYEDNNDDSFEKAENKALTAWKLAKNDHNMFYIVYEDKMIKDMVESKIMLDKLIKSVENDLLEIHLQPKFSCKNNKIIGAEALLRLVENGKFISPSMFIPIAEETGFITTLDSYVFEKVCKIINQFKTEKINIGPVSVNISRKKIEQFNLVEEYETIMDKYNISKSEIELEITEGTILSDNTVIQKVIKKLKKSNFKILVDDFGTGYSSISMLKSLDIYGIKIDRSFISDESEKGKEILKYVAKLGHSLNFQITAEGVETKEQLEYLKKLNCDIIQGYYFSRPLSVDNFKKFVNDLNKDNNID